MVYDNIDDDEGKGLLQFPNYTTTAARRWGPSVFNCVAKKRDTHTHTHTAVDESKSARLENFVNALLAA